MELKPGTVRLAFAIIIGAGVILGTPVIIWAVNAPVADMEQIVGQMVGGILVAFGAAVAFYFGNRS